MHGEISRKGNFGASCGLGLTKQATLMLAVPTTHVVMLGQSLLFRGAGLSIVWPQLLMLVAIGTVFFLFALSRLRKSLRWAKHPGRQGVLNTFHQVLFIKYFVKTAFPAKKLMPVKSASAGLAYLER
ncbi:hypothetical protein [Chromohalobacter israelensis]|uniref:hypothetical protein n=1 Tax=Chromohalobacter israelensis TaxID=141390 RepID=UPI000D70FCFB|nr:hypothetical protein [Chromohalobacter salexigens]PWW31746.1 hypothetical protein DFO74_13616 [Chromohalobacter salexigens]